MGNGAGGLAAGDGEVEPVERRLLLGVGDGDRERTGCPLVVETEERAAVAFQGECLLEEVLVERGAEYDDERIAVALDARRGGSEPAIAVALGEQSGEL